MTFVCPEVACGGQLKIDKLQKLFSNLQILGEYLKIVLKPFLQWETIFVI